MERGERSESKRANESADERIVLECLGAQILAVSRIESHPPKDALRQGKGGGRAATSFDWLCGSMWLEPF